MTGWDWAFNRLKESKQDLWEVTGYIRAGTYWKHGNLSEMWKHIMALTGKGFLWVSVAEGEAMRILKRHCSQILKSYSIYYTYKTMLYQRVWNMEWAATQCGIFLGCWSV